MALLPSLWSAATRPGKAHLATGAGARGVAAIVVSVATLQPEQPGETAQAQLASPPVVPPVP